jgi:hypothetical protein
MKRGSAGAEVGIESGNLAVAVIHAPVPLRRSISKSMALLPDGRLRCTTQQWEIAGLA